MITLNTTTKLSNKVLIYSLLRSTISSLFVGFLLSFFVPRLVPALSGRGSLIFLAVFVVGYVFTFFGWKIFYYSISAENVTVHSGVLIQQTKSVNFNDLQSINAVFGPLLWAFGLSKVRGFTSSPEQLVVTSSSRGGAQTTHMPDLEIIMDKQTAEEFLQMAQKGDVQIVRNTTTAV